MNAALVIAACVALAALSLLLPSAPTYDPWAWLIWGREVVHLDLQTTAGPSWKPLPVLAAAVLWLAGPAAPDLWLVIARAGGLLALVAVFLLARRLAPARYGVAAGALAVLALLCAGVNFKIYGLSVVGSVALGNSEGLLIALVVIAIDQHLSGHRERVLACALGAALLRPEAWPFAALYALWAWHRAPALRRRIAVGFGAVLLLWFGPELWGSGHLLRSAERAQAVTPDNPALSGHPFRTVLSRARSYLLPAAQLGALIAVIGALVESLRRRRIAPVLAVAILGALWLAIVAGMAQAGLASGNPRYQQLPIALCCVLAGVGLAQLALLGERTVTTGWSRARADGEPQRAPTRRAPAATSIRWGAIAIVAGAAIVSALPRARHARADLDALGYEARLDHDLPMAIDRAGGRGSVLSCGTPATAPLAVTLLAYRLGRHIDQVGDMPGASGVVFQAPATATEAPAPALAPGDPRRLIASVGRWRVLSACDSQAAIR